MRVVCCLFLDGLIFRFVCSRASGINSNRIELRVQWKSQISILRFSQSSNKATVMRFERVFIRSQLFNKHKLFFFFHLPVFSGQIECRKRERNEKRREKKTQIPVNYGFLLISLWALI